MWPVTCLVTPSPDCAKRTTLLKRNAMGALVKLLTLCGVGIVLLTRGRTQTSCTIGLIRCQRNISKKRIIIRIDIFQLFLKRIPIKLNIDSAKPYL